MTDSKVVPREITDGMMHAAAQWLPNAAAERIWRAMYDAAPSMADSKVDALTDDMLRTSSPALADLVEGLREWAALDLACTGCSAEVHLGNLAAAAIERLSAAPSMADDDVRAALKREVSEILRAALAGRDGVYRTEDGFTRWGIVEEDLHAVVVRALATPSTGDAERERRWTRNNCCDG